MIKFPSLGSRFPCLLNPSEFFPIHQGEIAQPACLSRKRLGSRVALLARSMPVRFLLPFLVFVDEERSDSPLTDRR
uniref:Uncharacterized protein n=1 Tax=Candidatus Kentrum sp. SD TaxID=2126332 RepID=A0A450YN35_9GAMM|nr:MAG: hypothetical protein BECKSD772F_GA0070984_11333 [Candidatus Kentron sp. SD]VFK48506.1 MAG: hypothetical protein BECKSD772E_GA0070983_11285 [Candidatus Kentron sp. SD]VFK80369.1 MAG: hypothetical protein BECKSD772D_GA0070982_11076 [Candidatus Kentron sp. SD]